MKTKTITLIIAILLITNVFALTERERKDINEFADQIKNDRAKFEILLAFLDAKEYDLSNEPKISTTVEKNAKEFGIFLFPYYGIKGIDKEKIDSETFKISEKELRLAIEKAKRPIKMGFWPVVIILIVLLIIIFVLDFYRKEKVKKVKLKKVKRKKK